MVVLDNAPFHTAGWSESVRGLGGEGTPTLPAASVLSAPLNLIEGEWRRLKGFLMPRRFYDCVAELKQAVLHGLRLLKAVKIQYSLGDT